jgi:hypothetical protein
VDVAFIDDEGFFNVSLEANIRVDVRGFTQAEGGVTHPIPTYSMSPGSWVGISSVGFSGAPDPVSAAAWELPPLSWTATGEVEPFNPTGGVMTKRFDDGEGSQWFMVAPVVDSGNELRSKTIVAAHAMGRFTNANMQMYTWDVTEGVNLDDLEAGTNSSTGDIPIDDSTEVAQSVREPMNCKNAVLSTIRIEGDDRGQPVRDEVHELVVEQAIQGVRR